MAGKRRSITNANIYVNGGNFVGTASEVEIPEVDIKKEDHNALGMIGMTRNFSGIEMGEMTISWNSVLDAQKLAAFINPNERIQIDVRWSVRIAGSAGIESEKAGRLTAFGEPNNVPGMTFAQHTNVETQSRIELTAMKMVEDGVTVYDIDIDSNTFKVGGVDIMAKYKQNLGL